MINYTYHLEWYYQLIYIYIYYHYQLQVMWVKQCHKPAIQNGKHITYKKRWWQLGDGLWYSFTHINLIYCTAIIYSEFLRTWKQQNAYSYMINWSTIPLSLIPYYSIWANYNNSLTWILRPFLGLFPLLTMIIVRENSEVVIIYPDSIYHAFLPWIPSWHWRPQEPIPRPSFAPGWCPASAYFGVELKRKVAGCKGK